MASKKKKVLAGVAAAVVLAVAALGYMYYREQQPTDPYADTTKHSKEDKKRIAEASGQTVVDPVSGETVASGEALVQEREANEPPALLGFSAFEEMNFTLEQRDAIKQALTAFADSRNPKVNVISFYKDSYKESPPDEDGRSRLLVKIHTDNNGDFYMRVFYAEDQPTTVAVYQEDKTTEVFRK